MALNPLLFSPACQQGPEEGSPGPKLRAAGTRDTPQSPLPSARGLLPEKSDETWALPSPPCSQSQKELLCELVQPQLEKDSLRAEQE